MSSKSKKGEGSLAVSMGVSGIKGVRLSKILASWSSGFELKGEVKDIWFKL